MGGRDGHYREFTHHTGLLNALVSKWYPGQMRIAQHDGDEPSCLLPPVVPRSPERVVGVRRGPVPERV
ncbi:hypothetical protein ACGFY7_46860 [Streptomyces prunicolor]|uniref:hypothetical protein n=1 Tax=Streptomyces prunicolor TaxID=67348 RepID=UPI00370FC386